MPTTRQSDLEFSFTGKTLSIFRNRQEVRHITAWPKPFAEDLTPDGSGVRICPIFRIISKPLHRSGKNPDNQLELVLDIGTTSNTFKCSKKQAYDHLRQSIPKEYSTRLSAFYSHQWNPLRFLSTNGDFLELLSSNPPLAYFLANRSEISERVFCDVLKIDDLIRMPQTALMEKLRLPDTKKAVKLMRKLAPESASPENLKLFKTILESNHLTSKAAHLRQINTGILHLLNLKPRILEPLTSKLLVEISNDPQSRFSQQVAVHFKETVSVYNRLHGRRRQPLKIKSLKQLQELHTELLTWHTEQSDGQSKGTFPPPPIPGNRRIVPLKTGKALWTEGKAQHICVGGRRYADAVRAGEKYIYVIKEPQRATLSIGKGSGETWFISELHASCNQSVRKETREMIEEWLQENQDGI